MEDTTGSVMRYDSELLRLQQNVVLKQQLESKLNELREQRRDFDRKVVELRVAFRCEQEDVERLEERSLSNYFYRFVGKMDGMITEERRQVAAAQVKLEAAEKELSGIDAEIVQIQSQLVDLFGCEGAYTSAMRQKREALKESGVSAGTEVLELEEKIGVLKIQKREIQEALSAGRKALCAADDVLSELESAGKWNTWDMVGGGGIITHMVKHSYLDDAQAHVAALQGMLRRFKTELADINIQANIQVNVDGFLRFADFFYDGLFVDWAVGERIDSSKSSVISVRYKIQEALGKLNTAEREVDRQAAALNAKLEELLLHS